jgi:hypothetical protein
MAWLANLEARATKWPLPATWLLHFAKWWLAIVAAMAIFAAWTQNIFAPAWLQFLGDDIVGNRWVLRIVPTISATVLATGYVIRTRR